MELTPVVVLLFWTCLALVAYAYVGYPLVVWSAARCFGRTRTAPNLPDAELPTVSLLLSAYNEEAVVEQWIRNALALDYPAAQLDIVVASDGSSDATPQIVRRYAGHGVRLLDYRQRRGKAAVLRAAFAEVRGDIVVLSDANTHIEPGAVRCLARWFRDPTVGVVCGRLVLTDPASGHNADGLYWKYETFLKKQEDRLGALLGANGAIYALRRELHEALAAEAVVDDFVIPLRARLLTGCRLVYDAAAVAQEETPPDLRAEFHRRARLGAGGFQSIALLWRLLHPRHGWIAFSFLSHKILRWLCPFFLLGLLASNLCLLDEPLYFWAQSVQLCFYGLAVLTPWLDWLQGGQHLLKPLRLPALFTSMNAALLVGFWRWLRGRQNGAWRRTTRPSEAQGVV
ncbi:MAG: glycosyltransferase family 2 protein [Gemmataceae bacterium]|nr:glycosyltransferase family 2 protein [Gemmataceae bacterium]